MYPDPDSQAEQFDDALERRQAGEDPPADDPELQELVQLASRLEQTLPEDTPDPSFRNDLKQQLLSGEPVTTEPAELAEQPWHRQLVTSPWRLSAAAAAFLVVALVAVVMGMNPLSEDDDETSDSASFQAMDQEDSAPTGGSNSGLTGATEENQNWFASTFPPFDGDHVVLPPFLTDYLSRDDAAEPEPDVELNGADQMVADTDMPETAPVLYLSAPSNAETMLTTLRSTLEIDGEIQPGTDDGEPYRIVNRNQQPIITWEPDAAFFHFRGELLEEPVRIRTENDGGPVDVAIGFLERIGFDLRTIQYEHRVNEHGEVSEVVFRPSEFPKMGLELSLGGRIVVDGEGTVREAELFWLSLIDSRNATLRDPEEILRDVEGGDGYTPPMPDSSGGDQMKMDVEEVGLTHVLTRMDEGSFVLQPAMALSGELADVETGEVPAVAQYVVPAVEDGD